MTLTFDLWPWKPFSAIPTHSVTWWIFVASFIEILPLSKRIHVSPNAMTDDRRMTMGHTTTRKHNASCWWRRHKNDDKNTITHTPDDPNFKKYKKVKTAHLSAYHLRELATMTPLSTEKLSRGKPAMFHAWILIGSPSVLVNEKSDEHGILLACIENTKLSTLHDGKLSGKVMVYILSLCSFFCNLADTNMVTDNTLL